MGPESLVCALAAEGAPGIAWLDASDGSGTSLVSAWPEASLTSFRDGPDPLPALRGMLRDAPARHVVLALGYDLGARFDRFSFRAADDLGEPELEARRYPGVLAYDPASRRWTESGDCGRLRETLVRAAEPAQPAAAREGVPRRNFTRERYLEAIRGAKHLIVEGEVYQVNLAQRFLVAGVGCPLSAYRRLRRLSPAPYAACLDLGERVILSSSPELFLEVKGREVRTRPIKGTRPRGRTPEGDRRLLAELEASEKERAELAMIVDLERNDLGRVCATGSVRVVAPRRIASYATVHHAWAEVTGRLREGVGLVDLLAATFPGGSVTGCPKIRAIEIIDALEPTRRGIYCGAIGWAGGGEACLNVAIRTVSVSGGTATLHAGGAIVADSGPEAEYEETLAKAGAMLEAVGVAAVRDGERHPL